MAYHEGAPLELHDEQQREVRRAAVDLRMREVIELLVGGDLIVGQNM